MMMQIEEAKQIANQLQVIALKLSGTKNEDGTVSTKGVLTELDELVNKLNPTNVNFFNKMQVEVAQKSLMQIEHLLNEQRAEIESQTVRLEQSHLVMLEHERIAMTENLHTMLKPVYQKMQEEVIKHEKTLMQRILELESVANTISIATKTNYYYLGLSAIVSMMTGIMIGYSIL